MSMDPNPRPIEHKAQLVEIPMNFDQFNIDKVFSGVTLIIGKRCSGKTTIIRDYISQSAHLFSGIVCFSNTGGYSNILPHISSFSKKIIGMCDNDGHINLLTYDYSNCLEVVTQTVTEQQQLLQQRPSSRRLIVFDNCRVDLFSKNQINNLVRTSRHLGITCIISPCFIVVPMYVRRLAGHVFLLDSYDMQLWSHYGGMYSYHIFNAILSYLRTQNKALVINPQTNEVFSHKVTVSAPCQWSHELDCDIWHGDW